MRDPISRIESQIVMETIKSRETRKSFARELVSCCLYYTSLKNYLAVFPPEQILLVRSEDLLEQREETLLGICRFLGIKEDVSSMPLSQKINTRENQSIKLTSFFKILKFLRLESFGYLLYRNCPQCVRRIVKNFSTARLRTIRKLCVAEKKYVIDVLRPEIMALSTEFDFPLDKWQLNFDSLEETGQSANFFDLSFPPEQFISSFLGERATKVPSEKQMADNKVRHKRVRISPSRIDQ